MNHSGEFTYPDAKTPAKRTYWVVQNKLLAGAYPGQPDPAKHLARLQALYDAGMRTFINLQEEGETNNAGQPFVRYDGDLREVAAKKTTPSCTCGFPFPTAAPRLSIACNPSWTLSTYPMRQIEPSMCIASAARGEPEQPFVVGCCGTGMSIAATFFP